MISILNELTKEMATNAIVGIIIFYIGLIFVLFVTIPSVGTLFLSTNKKGGKKFSMLGVILFIVIMYLCGLDRMALFHRYEEYEINDHRVGLTKRLILLNKDKKDQETIIFEDEASVSVDDVRLYGKHGLDNIMYREGYLINKDYTLHIPIGDPESDYYKNVESLLFEKYEYPGKTNKIEVYKNSYLIKSINGIDLDDEEQIREFVIKEKNGMVEGKLIDGFTASLDVTQKGIVINPVYVSQEEYFENKDIILCSYKMNEATQRYEFYGMKDLHTEDMSMVRDETGKYKIFISDKFKAGNVLSDIIECEVEDYKVKSLKILDQENNLLKTINDIESSNTLNLVDYQDEEPTKEEKEAEEFREMIRVNNDNIKKRALENKESSDIFMSVASDYLYFYEITDIDNKPTAFMLSLKGYYNKEQELRKDLLKDGQPSIVLAISDTKGSAVENIPLGDIQEGNTSSIWQTLNDGEYIIQIKSTVVPTLNSNKLSIVIENKKVIKVYDADDENKPILWDIDFSKNNFN